LIPWRGFCTIRQATRSPCRSDLVALLRRGRAAMGRIGGRHARVWGVVLVALHAGACDRVASYGAGGRPRDAAAAARDAVVDRAPADRLVADGGDGRIADAPRDGDEADVAGDARADQNNCLCNPGDPESCGPCGMGSRSCRPDCLGFDDCTVPPDVCQPTTSRACGNCLGGEQVCGADCRWGACVNQPCTPQATSPCSNNCGERTCSAICQWSACSRSGDLVSPGQDCWSSNHCQRCALPGGSCVACWQKCDDDGNLHPDGWCQSCEDCAGRPSACPACP